LSKYAFIGAHGVGKSTAAYSLANSLKKQDPVKSIKVIEEVVRLTNKLVGINNLPFQKLSIFDSLYKQELYASTYDVIICDRTPLDYVLYGRYYKVGLSSKIESIAYENILEFNKVYFVRPDNTPMADDGFRFTDIKERNEIDLYFKLILDQMNIIYEEITTKDIFK
jgi:nicotinamide riboside kinase